MSLFLALLTMAALTLWVIAIGKLRLPLDEETSGQLRRRLAGYVSSASLHSIYPAAHRNLLSPPEHQILLGTLKKVEAKNSALIQAWALLLTATIALIALIPMEQSSGWCAYDRLAGLGMVFLAFPFLATALRGMKQLDQYSFQRMLGAGMSELLVPNKMQNGLMRDLLIKEACFRFSLCGAYAYVFLFTLLVGALIVAAAGLA